MKKNKFYLIAFICALFIVSCKEDLITYTDGQRIAAFSFAESSQEVGNCAIVEVVSGVESLQDQVVNISVNQAMTTALPSQYSIPTSVTIPAGSYTSQIPVELNLADVPDGQVITLVLELTTSDNTSFIHDSTTLSYSSSFGCSQNDVGFDFNFDNYPQEFAWQLYNAAGDFLAGDTSFGNYAGQTMFSTSQCLPDGDYVLVLFDAFGDGFCCGFGMGSATLTLTDCVNGTTEIAMISTEFTGSQFQIPFTLGN